MCQRRVNGLRRGRVCGNGVEWVGEGANPATLALIAGANCANHDHGALPSPSPLLRPRDPQRQARREGTPFSDLEDTVVYFSDSDADEMAGGALCLHPRMRV